MFTWRSGMVLAAVLAAGLVSLSLADEPKKGDDPKDTALKSSAKESQKVQAAAAIDFPAAFNLGFGSHQTLGSRIDEARRACDPVALAAAANELAVAEQVSGKKASLTAAQLSAEADKLAAERANSSELKALALLTRDDGAKKKLGDLASAAQKREDEAAAKVKSGERPKGITGSLTIINHTDDVLTIVVNGYQLGTVRKFGTASFFVGDDAGGETHLEAFSYDHHMEMTIERNRPNYTWSIDE